MLCGRKLRNSTDITYLLSLDPQAVLHDSEQSLYMIQAQMSGAVNVVHKRRWEGIFLHDEHQLEYSRQPHPDEFASCEQQSEKEENDGAELGKINPKNITSNSTSGTPLGHIYPREAEGFLEVPKGLRDPILQEEMSCTTSESRVYFLCSCYRNYRSAMQHQTALYKRFKWSIRACVRPLDSAN